MDQKDTYHNIPDKHFRCLFVSSSTYPLIYYINLDSPANGENSVDDTDAVNGTLDFVRHDAEPVPQLIVLDDNYNVQGKISHYFS